MRRFQRADAICPYYAGEIHDQLVCEGALGESSVMHHMFANPHQKEEVVLDLCCGEWKECPIARAIYQKYEDL